MRPYMLYSPSRAELSELASVMGFLAKKQGIAQLPYCLQELSELRACAEDPTALKLLVSDVTTDGILPILEQLRRGNPDMRLVLVADGSVPPVSYIRPSILPAALLWRPLQAEDARDTLWEVLRGIPAGNENSSETEKMFTVEVRGDLRQIPYQKILFFEASNKRLNLHTGRKEIPFSGTLEKLVDELPEEFIRVHKSYIVNRSAIIQIQFGQNEIILEGGIVIPISRSYKPAVKAVFS